MIPARRTSSTPSSTKQPESIPARLARLRSEQRGARRRFIATTAPLASPLRAQTTAAAAEAPPTSATRRSAGPPPPPSWISATDGEHRRGTWLRPEERVERRGPSPSKDKMLVPLFGSVSPPMPCCHPPSLAQTVGQVIARDLSLPPAESLLLEHVHLLPPHLRLRMFEVAALSWPLEERAIVQLLREEEEEDSAEGCEEGEGVEERQLEGSQGSNRTSEGDWEDEDNAGSTSTTWDVRLGDGRGFSHPSPFHNLTSFNLAYSPIKLPALRSLLLNITNPARPIPAFPHLHTLNLASTPSLHLTDSFFTHLLPHLLPLRHLSLAGKSLDHPSSISQSSFLPRLAAATPTLLSIDLSYATWPTILIKGVDWDVRWSDLRVLGMRRDLVDWKREEIGAAKKEKIRRAVWGMISMGRQRQRRWIEVVV